VSRIPSSSSTMSKVLGFVDIGAQAPI